MAIITTNLISRVFGKIADHKFSPKIQSFLNHKFVKITGIDMSDFKAIEEYKSINELFTRKLLKKREIEDGIISPTDSIVSEQGRVNNYSLLQIKGKSYSIRDLLKLDSGSYDNYLRLENGEYFNFYLSPKDYHRYHAPIDMTIHSATHISGALYPVNFKYLNKIPALYCENERVVLECATSSGALFYMVFVGALNVGRMRFLFDETIQTNAKKPHEILRLRYNDVKLKKGDEIGYFEMGSTVVMIFEEGVVKSKVSSMQEIKFGKKIAEFI